MESYITYNVCFNMQISEKEEEIKFTNFSEKFVDNITIKKVNICGNNKVYIRRVQINFRDEYLKEKDIDNIELFLIEFLYKFTLQTNSFFVFYIEQDIKKILKKLVFVDKIIFGRTNYNKNVTSYKEHRVFYNEQASIVIEFCKKNNIQYHIKKGTITNFN